MENLFSLINANLFIILILIFVLGLIIYSIHRTIFYIIDYSVIGKNENTANWNYSCIMKIAKYEFDNAHRKSQLNSSLSFKGAIIHYVAIMMELTVIFSFFYFRWYLIFISLLILSICIKLKIFMIKIEIQINNEYREFQKEWKDTPKNI